MITSSANKPLFVYLQLPDTDDWVVVGRYTRDNTTADGVFRYAQSYLDAGHGYAIDPVNLPLLPIDFRQSRRYGGLHDVLRDTCPDSWGQALLQRKHDLSSHCSPLEYLKLAGNGDRWGALAVGPSRQPSVAHLASPRLHHLDALVNELQAIANNLPPVNVMLRKHLFGSPSLGGARPKGTLQDQGQFWLVKPGLSTDTVDLALLEHVCQRWGGASGMRFAQTHHHPLTPTRSVVRVRRFDRMGQRRLMAISAASLLQTEYPPASPSDNEASYPRFAEELRRIGAPREDLTELFDRLVFNAVVGNDDDHARNHAVIFEAGCWRLAPAFDVVPNPDETPATLSMQICSGSRAISRDNLLREFVRFGFISSAAAGSHLDALLDRIKTGFNEVMPMLSFSLATMMANRLESNCNLLARSVSWPA